jgi:hypothetical protein
MGDGICARRELPAALFLSSIFLLRIPAVVVLCQLSNDQHLQLADPAIPIPPGQQRPAQQQQRRHRTFLACPATAPRGKNGP